MRDYSYTPSASRVVSAKVVFSNALPVFQRRRSQRWTMPSPAGPPTTPTSTTDGVMRVAVVGDHLAWQWIYYRSELVDRRELLLDMYQIWR